MPPALLVAAALGVWEVWVAVRHVEPYVLPTPARVARAGWDSAYLLPGHLITTITESLVGLVIGAVVGVALAVVIVRLPLARRVLYPVLVISQTVPMVVLAPLLLIWFGFGLTPKVVVVALIVFFPVLVSTVSGIDGADRDLVDLVRSMGAGPRQVLLLVLVPSAVPAFFAGLRIAAAYTVGGAVIAEYMGGSSGLGVFINRSHSSYNVDRIFVAVVIIGVLTAALFAAVDVAARWAAPWQEPDRPHVVSCATHRRARPGPAHATGRPTPSTFGDLLRTAQPARSRRSPRRRRPARTDRRCVRQRRQRPGLVRTPYRRRSRWCSTGRPTPTTAASTWPRPRAGTATPASTCGSSSRGTPPRCRSSAPAKPMSR